MATAIPLAFINGLQQPFERIGDAWNLEYIVEACFVQGFPGSVSNQKYDLYFTGGMEGVIEVHLIGGYGGSNAEGTVIKRYVLGANATGTIYTNVSRVIEVLGNIATDFTLSEITWDATNNRYRIQIVHRTTTSNNLWIRVRAWGGFGDTVTTLSTLAIGPIYTTDTTVFDAPIRDTGISGLTAGRVPYATSATTLGDDAEFLYNSTTNTLSVPVLTTPTTNGPLTVAPNGTGALVTDTGGNARGNYATDLQRSRGAATQVASGLASAILAGTNNTAAAQYATASGYNNNVQAAANSSTCFGYNNSVASDFAFCSGYNNSLSGTTTVVLGYQCTTTTHYCFAQGYYAYADHVGQFARATGRFAAAGDAQTSSLVAFVQTTTATQTEMWLNGANARLTLVDQDCWAFSILVVARRQDADNEGAGWEFKGVIDRNGATTALVGSVTKTELANDNTGVWDCNVSADDTNDALIIQVTGEASKTIRWVARITLAEVNG